MEKTVYLAVYFDDRQDPTNFGIVSDTAFPTFEEAKEEVIKQLSAELQAAIINGHKLTAEEINSRLDEARERIESLGDDYLSDYASCIFGVRKVCFSADPAETAIPTASKSRRKPCRCYSQKA